MQVEVEVGEAQDARWIRTLAWKRLVDVVPFAYPPLTSPPQTTKNESQKEDEKEEMILKKKKKKKQEEMVLRLVTATVDPLDVLKCVVAAHVGPDDVDIGVEAVVFPLESRLSDITLLVLPDGGVPVEFVQSSAIVKFLLREEEEDEWTPLVRAEIDSWIDLEAASRLRPSASALETYLASVLANNKGRFLTSVSRWTSADVIVWCHLHSLVSAKPSSPLPAPVAAWYESLRGQLATPLERFSKIKLSRSLSEGATDDKKDDAAAAAAAKIAKLTEQNQKMAETIERMLKEKKLARKLEYRIVHLMRSLSAAEEAAAAPAAAAPQPH